MEREKEDILNKDTGTCYRTKWGVIDLVFSDNIPSPSALSPEEIDSHILGVILANQYNMKTGKELFDNLADEAVMHELSEMNDLEIHKSQIIKDLPYEDNNRALGSGLLISDKRANHDGHEIGANMWQLVASSAPTMDMKSPIGIC